MKNYIKKTYNHTLFGKVILHPVRRIESFIYYHFIPEKLVVKIEFKRHLGYKLNLKDPQTFNEKLQWLKLNIKTPLHSMCADKCAVRNYVSQITGNEYLVPLIFRTYEPSDIVPENLPDFPFIIKTNHDSGPGIIIYEKSEADWINIQKIIKRRLKHNYFYRTKEWPYKNIKPCILVEKLLLDERGKIPNDYKFHCFNHKVQMIQVDIDRWTTHHCRNWYNVKWERQPYMYYTPTKVIPQGDQDVVKPKLLDKMITLSEKLSDPFYHVRVDLYYISDKIYFGELTFTPGAGYSVFEPPEWDLYFGKKLKIPIRENNH